MSQGGASTAVSSRAVSKGGGAAGADSQAPASTTLAQLGAKAEAAASRPLVLTSAVDSSLQAVQAAKLSLQSMHEKDIRLELISQSVKDVLEGKVGVEVACSCGTAANDSNTACVCRLPQAANDGCLDDSVRTCQMDLHPWQCS